MALAVLAENSSKTLTDSSDGLYRSAASCRCKTPGSCAAEAAGHANPWSHQMKYKLSRMSRLRLD